MNNEKNETILNQEDKLFLDYAVSALEKGVSLSVNLQRRLVHLLHQIHHKSVSQSLKAERDKRAESDKRVIVFKPGPKSKNYHLVEWMGLKDN